MNAKYVVFSHREGDAAIIIPSYLNHQDQLKDYQRDNVISAGELRIRLDDKGVPRVECYGRSSTLKVRSRGDDDVFVIEQMLRIGRFHVG